MKKVQDLRVRKIGSRYMLVAAQNDRFNLTNVYTLNAVAADIWNHVGMDEILLDEIVQWLTDVYEVDRDTARKDVEKLLSEWLQMGLLK